MPFVRKWVKETELDEMRKHPERFNPLVAIPRLVDEVRRLKVRLDETQALLREQDEQMKASVEA